uniref:Phospholipase A1 n=1 Tax=Solanum chacoense TaxID=4108 RepID=A0A0V0GMK3_SOLCH
MRFRKSQTVDRSKVLIQIGECMNMLGMNLKLILQKSEYLKKDVNNHTVEVYLHGIAGTHGAEGEFKLEINRDIALVNKEADALKNEYGVPVYWRIVQNKGMVQQEDGSWILNDREDDTDLSE